MTNEQKQVVTLNMDSVLTKMYADFYEGIDRAIMDIDMNDLLQEESAFDKIQSLLEARRIFTMVYKDACRTKLRLVR